MRIDKLDLRELDIAHVRQNINAGRCPLKAPRLGVVSVACERRKAHQFGDRIGRTGIQRATDVGGGLRKVFAARAASGEQRGAKAKAKDAP